jgi:hypothetical protein
LRFRSSASAYLNRTPATASNQKTWTWSGWVKLGLLANWEGIFQSGTTGTTQFLMYMYTDANLWIQDRSGGSNNIVLQTTQVFRDPSAWYHIVLAVDTTQATSTNRVKLYVNGSQVTAFTSSTYPSQNYDTQVNSAVSHFLGNGYQFNTSTSKYYDGYMAEVQFVDGYQLTPNSFGTFNSYGVWQPITYGGSYGTNGFYLPFTGSSSYYGSFNGSNQYLQATLPATLTGAFTIEFLLYRNGSGNQFCFTLGDSNTSTGLEYYIGTTGTVNNVYSNGAQISTTSNLPTVSAWNHITVTRDSSNVVRLFVNGTQAGSTWTSAAAFSSTLRIGVEYYNSGITGYVNGNVSNFRIINGTALYTGNFAPPTSALTAVSGTSILTLQSSTIIDNSGNSLSITNNGTVVTSQAYPFTMLANQSKDYSPNGNNWTNNNIGVVAGSTLDVMTDVPTLTSATAANYAVLNPLMTDPSYPPTSGNLINPVLNNQRANVSTIAFPSTGTYVCEMSPYTSSVDICMGICLATTRTQGSTSTVGAGAVGDYLYYQANGNKISSAGSVAYGSALAVGDILGIVVDTGAGTITFYKNGTSLGVAYSGLSGTFVFCAVGATASTNSSVSANFGQRPFSYTYGSAVALNTYNL